ncbi:Kua-ubiquitin conjugating enzyme hybrid, localization [Nannochloropsis gaditana]|uniref:Kua-ubiquitin conjugating enzyme hybrid, localization n=1 Tax=Nannochloropsis gaditana TaxID=72520 RepID=W7U0R7_9STRA|nr:Kua-ubiquitin conjugating enzyme hybrid, localization [Nannochloropsis gaditana]
MKPYPIVTIATLAIGAVAVHGFVIPAPSSRRISHDPWSSTRFLRYVDVLQSTTLPSDTPGISSNSIVTNGLYPSDPVDDASCVSTETNLPISLRNDRIVEKKSKRRGPPPPVMVADGDVLESSWIHRSYVATHYLVTLAAMQQVASTYAGNGGVTPGDLTMLAATTAFSVLFSDFFSGIFHWSVDNYGNGKTPVLGTVIEAFQGHHDAPWTITYRQFSNNVHKITKITIPAMLAIVALHPSSPLVTLFATLFFNLQVLSQEFHKLSHLSKPPAWAVRLQDLGLIISRKEHGQHHSSPFESNYCILTGTCNRMLDESGFFRFLEKAVYDVTGVMPNCWKQGSSEFRAEMLVGRRGGADANMVDEKME